MKVARDDLQELIDELPAHERDAIEAMFYERVTYRELARRWGSSQTHAWRVTHRALARIKLALLLDEDDE